MYPHHVGTIAPKVHNRLDRDSMVELQSMRSASVHEVQYLWNVPAPLLGAGL